MSRPSPSLALERIRDHLAFLYGPDVGTQTCDRLCHILHRFSQHHPPRGDHRLTEADAILITYGDQVQEPERPPLQTLASLLEKYLQGVVSGVHLLPFFPYSSDDGFSVIDYRRVDPRLGDWQDVMRIGRTFRLMLDAVINHVSAQSHWFQAFLKGDPAFADYFITVSPGTDLSMVTRPRALPLLTTVQTHAGPRHVWTTFSADQIDLNYANPQVLLDIIELLLFYVDKGAEIIRLDAIAYLWKEIGTSCIHLPQTHRVVQLFRAVLDVVAPHVLLITETNVPHSENISYFGDGTNEAQMVYQFSLAPLLLNAFHTGDAGHLSEWAAGLSTPSPTTTFFNFTASHDGIGVRPAEGILSAAEIQQLVHKAQAHGGFVSFKTNPDGTQSPYELNISYFDALSDPARVAQEGLNVQISRFIASQAIMLALAGVPGIYFHSLFGSRSWREGVAQTGRYRTINREKLQLDSLEAALADPTSLRHQVFKRYVGLLRKRAAHLAFHPNGPQQVLRDNPAVFALLRTSPDGRERLLCLHNVSDAPQPFQASLPGCAALRDLVSGTRLPATGGQVTLTLFPYQVAWLQLCA